MSLPDDIIKHIIDFLPYDENILNNILNKDIYTHIQSSDNIIDKYIIYDKIKHYKYKKRFKRLYIDNSLDHTLDDFINLKEIIFRNDFNKSISAFLPFNLEKVSFGKNFNLPIDNLPDTINSISFSYSFNKSINKLPNNLSFLSFGACYNKAIFCLPENLTILSFGDLFNNNLIIPPNLKELYFGLDFNREIISFPKSLKKLHFGARYNQPLHLTENLDELRIYILYNHNIILPRSLKKLIIWGFLGDKIELDLLMFKLKRILTYSESIEVVIENNERNIIKNFKLD